VALCSVYLACVSFGEINLDEEAKVLFDVCARARRLNLDEELAGVHVGRNAVPGEDAERGGGEGAPVRLVLEVVAEGLVRA